MFQADPGVAADEGVPGQRRFVAAAHILTDKPRQQV